MNEKRTDTVGDGIASKHGDVTGQLLEDLDAPSPRYTSFPTADRFTAMDWPAYEQALATEAQRPDPWTLYVHLPFCPSLCLYCGCNVRITRKDDVRRAYLDAVGREVDAVAGALDAHRPEARQPVASVHLGGGTPNYYSPAQLEGLLGRLHNAFDVTPDAELAIEVDPRLCVESTLPALRQAGFNRLSMGIQDFDPVVQRAIGRECDYDHAAKLRELAAATGFRSVNFDLIYGLPYQTPQTFQQTMRMVIQADPDRIALYAFAYVPWVKRHQRALEKGLPDRQIRWRLYEIARDSLHAAGYVTVGMDHFAKPADDLAAAVRRRTMRRSFQGYTASEQPRSLAFGASAIGKVGDTFVQNARGVDDYMAAVEARGTATARGMVASSDDRRNGWVIEQLMCYGDIHAADFEARFDVPFAEAYAEALASLGAYPLDQLVERADANGVRTTSLGRRFIRRVAAAFDPYLVGHKGSTSGPDVCEVSFGRYSRTV